MRQNFWSNVKNEWAHNSALMMESDDGSRSSSSSSTPGSASVRAHSPPAFFECNHDNDALDVAIHVRRGDVFDSAVSKDADRLLGIGGE